MQVGGQDTSSIKKEKNWYVKGYISDMRTITPIDGFNDIMIDNLLHNRINFKWYISNTFTTVIEMRNRLFYGERVESIPGFGKLIKFSNDDFFKLSHLFIDEPSIVLHSMIDRAYLDFAKGKWEVRVGRQRINWGINTVWNPNDLFNVFSFFDFDYGERPGSDAVRIQYYGGATSGFEIAAKVTDDIDKLVAAGLWKFHKWNYDFQALGGVMQQDMALGGGWAGNLKNIGFKGEATYFHPYENLSDSSGILAATLGFDYSFANSLYLSASYLYNSGGVDNINFLAFQSFDVTSLSLNLSPKNLFPYKHTFFAQASYPFSPVVNGGLSTIYSIGDNVLFVNPILGISLKENWDLSIISQLFFGQLNNIYTYLGQSYFLRLKWSY